MNHIKRKVIHNDSISFSQYAKLRALFEQKNWEIDEELEISTFERYFNTLSKLSVEQQDFMLQLSSRFLHIEQTKYLKELLGPLKELRNEPTLKSKACLKCLYFTIIIFDLCRYLEYFSYLYTINQTE